MDGFILVESVTVAETEKKDEDKEEILEFFRKMDKEILKDVAGVISTLVRALDGKPIEEDDIITRLTNVKNILERSRFPTYPLLAKQVYLRLLHKYAPEEGIPYFDWAEFEAEALISYKGKSREEYTEQLKHASGAQEEHRFYFGESPPPLPKPKRRGLLSRFRREPKEETEFTAQ